MRLSNVFSEFKPKVVLTVAFLWGLQFGDQSLADGDVA